VAGHLCFVDLSVLVFVSLFFWARLCCGPNKLVVSCGCYINIAGQKRKMAIEDGLPGARF
jgi:hypothetical protein